MPHMLRVPDLALGQLEREVLDVLWAEGPLTPGAVHERVGTSRGISCNTVSSALKRLQDKHLLEREKVSHAYVYRPVVTRAELQRRFIEVIASQLDGDEGSGLLAAFVDLAQERGEETLRRLEQMIAERLSEEDE